MRKSGGCRMGGARRGACGCFERASSATGPHRQKARQLLFAYTSALVEWNARHDHFLFSPCPRKCALLSDAHVCQSRISENIDRIRLGVDSEIWRTTFWIRGIQFFRIYPNSWSPNWGYLGGHRAKKGQRRLALPFSSSNNRDCWPC